jgi:hypothetical protein
MPRDGAIIFRNLVGKLDVLNPNSRPYQRKGWLEGAKVIGRPGAWAAAVPDFDSGSGS